MFPAQPETADFSVSTHTSKKNTLQPPPPTCYPLPRFLSLPLLPLLLFFSSFSFKTQAFGFAPKKCFSWP